LHELPPRFHLIPGMELTAEVTVGKRTVLSYFIDPVLQFQDESLKEP